MSFVIDTSDIHLSSSYPAGTPFAFDFEVHYSGSTNTTGHTDHVEISDHQNAKVVDDQISAPPLSPGQDYQSVVQVPALTAGTYDVAVTVAGGAASNGATIHVQ